MFFAPGYLRATRHPLMSGSFVLALLLIYELGIYLCSGGDDLPWRTGLDAGIRLLLRPQGSAYLEWLPLAAVGLTLVVYCCLRRAERPSEWLGTWAGMVVESFLLALPLLMLARTWDAGVITSVSGQTRTANPTAIFLSSLGAGVYEEFFFRLVLISLLARIGGWFGLNVGSRTVLALGLSAITFALAHHIPPFNEPYQKSLLLFRTIAGVYFGLLFWLRGLGIAAGAHACYDLVASLS